MKKQVIKILVGLMLVTGAAGCAKPPTEEMNASQASIQAVTSEGANVYAKDELAGLQKEMAAAQDEIKVQEGKLFKNFDKAKEMIAKAKAGAEGLKPVVATRKEEAKQNAIAGLAAAQAAVTEAKDLLANAPKGKGTSADIEAMGADLNGLSESLPGVQSMIDSADYFGAADKAGVISQKAGEVSAQVKAAMEKMAASKKTSKKKK